MSDLISRSALLENIAHLGKTEDLTTELKPGAKAIFNAISWHIEQAFDVDAVPVVHGKWNRILRGNYECSRCGCSPYYAESIYTLHYCPNCGAKMDGGKDDDT